MCFKVANLVDKINERHMRKDIPEFRVGDTVRVDVWVKEGKKERKGIEKPLALVIEQMLSQKQIWHALKMV